MGGVEYLNGRGEVIDLADSRNGDRPPTGELGSATANDAIFTRGIDGSLMGLPAPSGPTEEDIAEMLRLDGKARSIEQVLTLPLRSADWEVVPADGDSGEAEWVKDRLTRPPWAGGMSTPLELVIGQMTSAVLYRRAHFEKVWAVSDDGDNVLDKLAFRPAHSCTLRRDQRVGTFQGFKQRFLMDGRQEEVTIKPDKAFVYIHGQHRDPLQGVSDLETAYAAFESKQKLRWLWFSALENHTLPKTIVKSGQTLGNEAEKQQLAEKVASLKGGGVVALDPGDEVDKFDPTVGDASGQSAFQEAMAYLDSEMSASVLAGFTDLTKQAGQGRGSFALSKDQSDFFLRSRQAVLGEMGTAFTAWVIADLVRWNFGPKGKVPRLEFGELAEGAATEALELFKELAGRPADPRLPGIFFDELTERVATKLNLGPDKIRKAIEERAQRAATPGGELRAGIEAAVQSVVDAGVAPTTPEPEPAEFSAPSERSSLAGRRAEPGDVTELARAVERLADRPAPAPQVTVEAPQVNVAPPPVTVNATVERGGGLRVERDGDGWRAIPEEGE